MNHYVIARLDISVIHNILAVFQKFGFSLIVYYVKNINRTKQLNIKKNDWRISYNGLKYSNLINISWFQHWTIFSWVQLFVYYFKFYQFSSAHYIYIYFLTFFLIQELKLLDTKYYVFADKYLRKFVILLLYYINMHIFV